MNNQRCRSCGYENLKQILDLGFAPPSNALLNEDDLSKGEVHYPLVLLFCDLCKLVQTLDFHVGESLFTPNYPYLSSTSRTWVEHSYELVDSIVDEFKLGDTNLVVEVASNDGYLLERLVQRNIPCYGIEPTKLAADISLNKGHCVYNLFLNSDTASRIRDDKGTADIVIANNVFAHVPDLENFTKAIKTLMSENGVLIIEVQYFLPLFNDILFDTIYHEHYSYFTLTSISNLLQRHNFEIFKVAFLKTHGGSIRVYARNSATKFISTKYIEPFLFAETSVCNISSLNDFQDSVNKVKINLKRFFWECSIQEEVVVGLGAAAKGNTLINFLGLDSSDIKFVLDSAEPKQGKYLPGSHIPVYPLTEKYLSQGDRVIILPWNISTEFHSYLRENHATLSMPLYILFPTIQKIG